MERFEKIRISGNIAASIFIPLMLVFITHLLSDPSRKENTAVKYIELASNILSQDKKYPESVRQWAVDIINHYSNVKMRDPTKIEMRDSVQKKPSG